MRLSERYIKPILLGEKYAEQEWCYQLPETPTQTIEPNVIYRDDDTKEIKFVLLPRAISAGPYLTALEALNEADWSKSSSASQGRDPAFKHHPTFACDGEPVAIPRRLHGVGGQAAVGAVSVEKFSEVSGHLFLHEQLSLARQ